VVSLSINFFLEGNNEFSLKFKFSLHNKKNKFLRYKNDKWSNEKSIIKSRFNSEIVQK